MNLLKLWIERVALTVCLALILAACAVSGETTSAPDSLAKQPTAPTPSRPELSAGKGANDEALAEPEPKDKAPAKGASDCSPVPLGKSVLLTQWDQKLAGQQLAPVDPLTGARLCDYAPVSTGLHPHYALSPDRQQLAYVFTKTDDHRDSSLHLLDLSRWDVSDTPLTFNNWINTMTFSPSGNQLAITYAGGYQANTWPADYRLVLVQLDKKQAVVEIELDIAPQLVAYTSDGSGLVIYGVAYQGSSVVDGEPRVLIYEVPTLNLAWEQALPDITAGQRRLDNSAALESYYWWDPAVVFNPDKQALYIVHADEDRLTTVDFKQHLVKTVDIRPKMTWFDRLLALTAGVAKAKIANGTSKQAVLSPDGERLYVAGQTYETRQDSQGNWQTEQTPLGLLEISVASGAELSRMDTEAYQIALSPDGKALYLHGWSTQVWAEVLDLESQLVKARLPGRQLIPARRLDGAPILLASNHHNGGRTTLATLDPHTLAELRVWSVSGYADWVTD